MKEVCRTADLEIGWGYAKQVRGIGGDRPTHPRWLWRGDGFMARRDQVMSQQSVRQAARRSALDAQAVLRKERADRERRLEGLAVEVLTALGERDRAVQAAELRAGQVLRTMTDDEGLSVREAVYWCGNGLTVREITRLRRLHGGQQDGGQEGCVG
jgi:hypothetical protein